jgi:hypothetical protein
VGTAERYGRELGGLIAIDDRQLAGDCPAERSGESFDVDVMLKPCAGNHRMA